MTPVSLSVGIASEIVYSYVPALSYVISSKKICPSLSFDFVWSSFLSESSNLKLNCPALNSFPVNSFLAFNLTVVGSASFFVFSNSNI